MAGNETSAMLGQKRLKKSLERQSKTRQLHELAYGALSAAARPRPTQVSLIQEGHGQAHCLELGEEPGEQV